jgi:hypothetical protein
MHAVRSAKIRLQTYQLVGARQILQCVGQIKIGSSAQAFVPNPQFPAAWKTQWHNAGLIKFANFQIAIFRRELDR